PRELRALAAVFRIQLEHRIPCEKMARTLHRLLLAPVEGRLGPGPVLVAAHDMLHYVPFQALMDARGKYLLQKRAVRYVPSLSALAELARRPVAVSGKLLAVGSPAAGPSVPPLPKATEEVQRVSSYFKGATVFTGAAATEAAVKREIASAGTLHFACHGLLEADLPLYSGLVFAPGAGEDGRLELHEIFGLKLAAGLTVLSACQTALGSLSRGDELVCLARAFLYAGSQSVVASLWSVPDESTVVLMDRFYAAIGKGETRESALRAAALCLLADPKYREPYFWSAFSLFGKK
ncbi:MAG: CHAT domain-containing protein, partial [Candidatus Wallbacteria bacterium]|nr:CHAT domain-containing protein [Candidatus Wallbacteria bacterium]